MIQYNTNSFTSLLLIISGPWMRCRVIYTDLDREKAEHSTPLLSYLFIPFNNIKFTPVRMTQQERAPNPSQVCSTYLVLSLQGS